MPKSAEFDAALAERQSAIAAAEGTDMSSPPWAELLQSVNAAIAALQKIIDQ
ncbi:MAG: hypothetical protein HC771_20270 [Synechococcales cyanobacterium CRU_2_2]|nr:hypothetical protein [Synechococcales cyanobacterium CRU_2_2]